MVKIGVIDDNAGGMYLLGKLRQTLPCNYEFVLADKPFVGGGRALFARAEALTKTLFSRGCDAVVYSSVALAYVGRALSVRGNSVYYCETPVLHSATYTVSNVLVATCDPSATFLRTTRSPWLCRDLSSLPRQATNSTLWTTYASVPTNIAAVSIVLPSDTVA